MFITLTKRFLNCFLCNVVQFLYKLKKMDFIILGNYLVKGLDVKNSHDTNKNENMNVAKISKGSTQNLKKVVFINRPGVAGAVLQTHSLLIN